MVKLKINNTEFEAPEGSTILEIAAGAGLSIPTLCHKKGMPHYSSCMVCMVKDNRSGNLYHHVLHWSRMEWILIFQARMLFLFARKLLNFSFLSTGLNVKHHAGLFVLPDIIFL